MLSFLSFALLDSRPFIWEYWNTLKFYWTNRSRKATLQVPRAQNISTHPYDCNDQEEHTNSMKIKISMEPGLFRIFVLTRKHLLIKLCQKKKETKAWKEIIDILLEKVALFGFSMVILLIKRAP